jgi:hypothetical protein
MNNKSQASGMGISVVIAIIIFMAGMLTINIVKPSVTDARTDLSCSSASISDGTKLTCLIIDVVVPYFMIIVLSAAGGLITYRLLA